MLFSVVWATAAACAWLCVVAAAAACRLFPRSFTAHRFCVLQRGFRGLALRLRFQCACLRHGKKHFGPLSVERRCFFSCRTGQRCTP